MPFVESYSYTPEWLSEYQGYCVLLALESMFGQILDFACHAPQSVYDLRMEQLAAHRSRVRRFSGTHPDDASIRRYFFNELIKDTVSIRSLIDHWIDVDTTMAPFIAALDLDFINEPFEKLCSLAQKDTAVGVLYGRMGEDGNYQGHIFHLHRQGIFPAFDDISDHHPTKQTVRSMLRTGIIDPVLESSRRECGFSALIIPAWC